MSEIDIGAIYPLYKGAWSSGAAYDFLDMVTKDGSSYLCIAEDGVPAGTAVTNTTYWGQVAQKGDTGATGPQGPKGDTGATGPQGPAGASGVLGTQVFTASTTVTVPAGATKAILSGCGGGGGSCGRTTGYNASRWVNNPGGNGGQVLNYPVSVSAGSSIKITVGAGGAAGGTAGSSAVTGSAGGVTSFGSLLSLGGGGGTKVADNANIQGANGSQPIDGLTTPRFGKRVGNVTNAATQSSGYGVGGRGISGSITSPIAGQAGRPGILIVTWAK